MQLAGISCGLHRSLCPLTDDRAFSLMKDVSDEERMRKNKEITWQLGMPAQDSPRKQKRFEVWPFNVEWSEVNRHAPPPPMC